jgi:hypothetical protein
MPGLFPCVVTLMVNQFSFKCVEKTFCHRVIPAIALSAHALLDGMGFKQGAMGF